ncbi:Ig-like domain-containing protein [Blattabacterium sp. (Blaberus giganteus)]|uniref:Ig-like domain-containing protein n=1 Tax=Blattabacterium sp. (Blaberus giganteus) TaxID=1186051 RepID=UPI00025F6F5B|nr:Ig-like domain-containing protein [Blattabacterium sp. (Blaberus giganteus)]AFJ90782.1 hypothetical protein BGIGA_344 [Blattabacterium sp. (Blaberus giganteus)]
MKIFFIFFSFFLISCANYKPLTGGNVDILSPRFIYSIPNNFSTDIQVNLKKIQIFFDENIILNNIYHHNHVIVNPYYIRKYIIIHPGNLPRKYISIRFIKTLKKNTTYSIQFNNCIKDNKEENVLSFFEYVFSTGKNIDLTYIKGNITNFKNKKNTIIGLYKYNDDMTLSLKKKPDYIAFIDYENNKYKILHIEKGKYLLFCFYDENDNQIYEPNKKELIFFKKTLFLSKDQEYLYHIQISK